MRGALCPPCSPSRPGSPPSLGPSSCGSLPRLSPQATGQFWEDVEKLGVRQALKGLQLADGALGQKFSQVQRRYLQGLVPDKLQLFAQMSFAEYVSQNLVSKCVFLHLKACKNDGASMLTAAKSMADFLTECSSSVGDTAFVPASMCPDILQERLKSMLLVARAALKDVGSLRRLRPHLGAPCVLHLGIVEWPGLRMHLPGSVCHSGISFESRR